MPPFRYDAYNPTPIDPAVLTAAARARAQALREQGQAQAQTALIGGQQAAAIAGTLGQLAGLPMQIQQQKIAQSHADLDTAGKIADLKLKGTQIDEATRKANEEKALTAVLSDPKATPEMILKASPTRGADIIKGLNTIKESERADFQWNKQNLATLTGGILALPKEFQEGAYQHLRERYIQTGQLKADDLPETFDPNWLQSTHIGLMTPDKQEETINPKAVSVAGIGLVQPPTTATPAGRVLFPTERPKSFQQKNVLLDGKPSVVNFDPSTGQNFVPGSAEAIDPKRVGVIPPASLQINPNTAGDTQDLAQMLVDGNLLPVDISKRGASYNATIAKANRIAIEQTGKPLNVTKLKLDYEAAKRFAGSMNSNQMVRFKGLAGSVVNTIDEVKRLADELKQGGIQKWNAAKRGSILQVYGNTPQSEQAAQYIGAVNTLKEEFANLANGGYAPTEAAWGLANQQINGDFGVKDLNASLAEVQRLINYRIGAFDELRPTLTAPQNAPTGNDPMGIR